MTPHPIDVNRRRHAVQEAIARILSMLAADATDEALLDAVAREAADLLGVEQVRVSRDPDEGSGAYASIRVGAGAWGTISATPRDGSGLPPDADEILAEFAELVAIIVGCDAVLSGFRWLACEQGIADRLARLVAGGAATGEILAAVAVEVAGALGGREVIIGRYETDGAIVVVGSTDPRTPPGTLWRREPGAGSAVRVPIALGDAVWGVVHVPVAKGEQVRLGTRARLHELSKLVSSAVANARARDDLQRLATEQAALRRVATLIAEQPPSDVVFDAVASEASRALDLAGIGVYQYNADGSATILATTLQPTLGDVGARWPLDGPSTLATIRRTGRPGRIDNFSDVSGTIAAYHRSRGFAGSAGAPIEIAGSVWGAVVAVAVRPEPLPPGIEHRIADFTKLLATAIANVQARSDLDASRARVVAAADEERRRVVRDLHDGAQQRLVHTIVTLKLAQQALRDNPAKAESLVAEALENAQQGNAELRELAHGILPALLSEGGLRAGVDTVVARLDLPVELDVPARRFPPDIEASAYFIVAEALTNLVKYSQAARAEVRAFVDDGMLHVEVRDDGIGGADPAGHGLMGLGDRATALGGQLTIESPRGGGTVVAAALPLASPSGGPASPLSHG